MNLKRTKIQQYRCILEEELFTEETNDIIVPDSRGDIARILDTDGYFLLGDKNVGEGECTVTGTLVATVLYRPEDGEALCSLGVTLPFRFCVQNAALRISCVAEPVFRLKSLETHMLNSRKILVKGEIGLHLRCFDGCVVEIAQGVEEAEDLSLEVLTEEQTQCCITGVQEKPVSIQEEQEIADVPEELLLVRPDIVECEARTVGAKIVVKGAVRLLVLFRLQSGEMQSQQLHLPFSQILESGEETGEVEPRLNLCLQAMSCQLSGSTLAFNSTALVQVVLTRCTTVTVLRDAYTTTGRELVTMQDLELSGPVETGDFVNHLRTSIKTPQPPRQILCAWMRETGMELLRNTQEPTVRSQVEIHVLYRGEDGAYAGACEKVEETTGLSCSKDTNCLFYSRGSGELSVLPGVDSLEVRGNCTIAVQRWETAHLSAVGSVEIQPGTQEEAEEARPSLILRRVEAGQSLWNIAKSCRTTCQAIRTANQLEGEPEEETMLLIPKSVRH